MAVSHAFELKLLDGRGGGTVVEVYDKYDLVIDMLRPGSPWTFSLWNSGESDEATETARHARTWRALINAVQVGGQILFSIDGAPQLNGVIETLQVPVEREAGARIILSGRDLSGPALDWDADPRVSLKGVALEECLRQLFNRVGIQAVVGLDADAERQIRTRSRPGARNAAGHIRHRRKSIDLSHARPDERVWQVAESIVRKLGLMMWVAPCEDGVNQMAVVIDVPKYDQEPLYRFVRRSGDPAGRTVAADSNILESAFNLSIRGVPTHVYAAGHAPRGDAHPARFRVDYPNTRLADDPRVANPLPPQPRWLHTARALNPATAQREAERVTSDAMARHRTYECTVQGHGQYVDGRMRLYAPNTMAHVYDRVGGFTLLDEDMLVTGVHFMGSRKGGQTSRLTLGTKGAIQLTPDPS